MWISAQRPPLANSQQQRHILSPSHSMLLSTVVLILAFLSTSTAYEIEFNPAILQSEHFQKLAGQGQIHFDQGEPPLARLQRREDVTQSVSSIVSQTSTLTTMALTQSALTMTISSTASHPSGTTVLSSASGNRTTSMSSADASATSATASVTVITTPLPSPFDTSLGNNFTSSSCPKFFSTFLTDSTFQSCLPVSMMLQNSNSFFRAERSTSLLDSTLDTSCKASLAICTPLLNKLASDLLSDNNCGQDFRNQNPLVQQAYNGFIAYEPVYRATCLKDPTTGGYCFTTAIANSSNAGDSYPYFTAMGLNMPSAAKPSCSECLRKTLQIFADYALKKSQPLAQTYLSCANQVDQQCGADFANTQVQVDSVDDGTDPRTGSASSIRAITPTLAIMVVLVCSTFAML